MGKITTVWSPQHGQFGTTATATIIAATNKKTLITHTQYRMSALEKMFGLKGSVESGAMDDSGLNSLVYSIISHKITKDDVDNACVKITENLHLLPSLGQSSRDEAKKQKVFVILTQVLPEFFDNVVIDLPSGINEENKRYWEVASTNLVVINHNVEFWHKYPDIPRAQLIMSKYDKDSKNTALRCSLITGYKTHIIPYNTTYMDAISSGKVSEFLLSNENILNKDIPVKKNKVYTLFKKSSEVKIC